MCFREVRRVPAAFSIAVCQPDQAVFDASGVFAGFAAAADYNLVQT
jgi:hypothetical protein